jgi:hypothetical protein
MLAGEQGLSQDRTGHLIGRAQFAGDDADG